ncbi:formate hydrogenlyase maturation protein HycH [Thermanaerosceptrum fracticalcis]|uniref:Formate hydrogenlyase maturation protein HycH n=1 Tax=Thermanaerosceptrum fracticalcis TaxID=1712410 RepID=A0A7G6E3J8_THEFR|nr:formate hydrogenlyase maturation HycH family protein [Thermanaerosceptrum fracticalcis]QNB46652.1 formate hydrogenlyase maturation protein HycH [Thermanaerosceptrum fracticalcis]
MSGKVEFYRLSKKFVDEKEAPPQVKQLEYYALAIGHHVGVVDCFSPVMNMAREEYLKWIAKLPQTEARRKMEGVVKWGEVEITREHVRPLIKALTSAAPVFLPEEKKWVDCLLQLLWSMEREPAIYLVVRSL